MIRLDENVIKEKKIATAISVLSNATLIIMKLIAGVISGSISIISEAIHSLSDILASFIAFFSVLISSRPADSDHAFGHGKYEDLSGFIEGGLIILASVFIAIEATRKIIFQKEIFLSIDLAIYVMGISAVINIIVSSYLFKIAKKSSSLAVYADAEHLRTDVISSLGVCVGLVLIKITHIQILDPIIALIVSVVIFLAGAKICIETKNNLLDKSLDENDINKIKSVIEKFINEGKLEHLKSLKTRKSGVKKDIVIVLEADKDLTLLEGHDYCDKIEQELSNIFGNVDVTIHLEPSINKVKVSS